MKGSSRAPSTRPPSRAQSKSKGKEVIDLTAEHSDEDSADSDIQEISALPKSKAKSQKSRTPSRPASKSERARKKSGDSARSNGGPPVASTSNSTEAEDGAIEEVDEEEVAAPKSNGKLKKKERRLQKQALAAKQASSGQLSPANGASPAIQPGSSSSSIEETLFMMDDKPAAVDEKVAFVEPDKAERPAPGFIVMSGLMLPENVVVEGATLASGATIAAYNSDSDFESDDDDILETGKERRYWMPEKEFRESCNICGEMGHPSWDCTHKRCWTCGALDDHDRCFAFVTCFRCGQKGHQRSDCTNRPANLRDPCPLCGRVNHLPKDCSTLWRRYAFYSPSERNQVLEARKASEGKPLLQGGEGFLGKSPWCFTCGAEGHWGFDCQHIEDAQVRKGPPAFSQLEASAGPFRNANQYVEFDRTPTGPKPRKTTFGDGYGFSAPANPGQQAKQKAQQKMSQQQREARERDEQDDWFDRRASGSNPKAEAVSKRDIERFRERERERELERERQRQRDMDRERDRRMEAERRERDRYDDRDRYRGRPRSRSRSPDYYRHDRYRYPVRSPSPPPRRPRDWSPPPRDRRIALMDRMSDPRGGRYAYR